MVRSKGPIKNIPWIAGGCGHHSTAGAPLTLEIYGISADNLDDANDSDGRWLVNLKKESNHRAALTDDFNRIKYSLSTCIQQCLYHEPLLAIALSTCHRPGVQDFHKGIYECFKESHAERTLCALSGEHLERVVFAALQVANGKEIKKPNNLKKYLIELVKLLLPTPDTAKVKVATARKFKVQNKNIQYKIVEEIENSSFKIDEVCPQTVTQAIQAVITATKKRKREDSTELAEEKMLSVGTVNEDEKVPWFIPASEFPSKHKTGFPCLFKDKNLDIAALIPTKCNARLDISAAKWPPNEDGEKETSWMFEVRARTNNYTKNDAIKDLIKKCGDHENVPKHHVMLIAICGNRSETECHGWTVGEKKYIRVVLLVAG